MLTRYAVERLLYRLSRSEYRDRVVLKGALLFFVWTKEPYRPTRDVDFLGLGDSSADEWRGIIGSVCSIPVEADGLIFDRDSIRIAEIREEQDYGGQRIRLEAKLGRARIPVQVDIGFGDAVTPEAEIVKFPTLLDMPAPEIKAYPQESFIAEKLHTIVVRGIASSRMSDYYDLWYMTSTFSLEGDRLVQAIENTFRRRQTEIPAEELTGLSEEYVETHAKDWTGFLQRSNLENSQTSLNEVIEVLRVFLLPPLEVAAVHGQFNRKWHNKQWR